MINLYPIFSSFLAVTHVTDIDNDELVKYAYSLKEKYYIKMGQKFSAIFKVDLIILSKF